MDAMRSRSVVTCTTHKLNALNSRLSDASADCLILTEQVHLRKALCHEDGMVRLRAWFSEEALDLLHFAHHEMQVSVQ